MNKRKHQPQDLTLLQHALQHHQAGRLEQAEAIYKSLGDHPDALNLQGLIAYQTGRNDEALTLIGQAVRANPAHAAYHFNLALVHGARNMPDAAAAAYRQAVALKPDYVDAHNNLGLLLLQQGRPDDAIACFRRAVALRPDYAEAHNNLGLAWQARGDGEQAAAAWRRAIRIRPDYVEANFNLGVACKAEPAEAAACYRKVLERRPDFAEALNNLGAACQDLGRWEEAAACCRRALAVKPDYAEAHYNLGIVHKRNGSLEQAASCYRRALELQPGHARAHNNLGDVYRSQGKLAQAMACFREALRIDPGYADAHSNLLFCINYDQDLSSTQVLAAYRDWNERHAVRLHDTLPPPANDRDPRRRLRIGYVSPDFNAHPVIHFAAPLIESRDAAHFETFCYYSNTVHDAHTERMMAASDHWIACKSLSDAQLAQRIRDDRIDILVDLAGHTAGNRLLAFARKPAPVQASWLGFSATTGLTAIDYFIGDPVLTPPGAESLFSEHIYRLPHAAWAYQPPPAAPDVAESPAARHGHVTFGCLSRSERINAGVIAAWAAILARLPDARLRLDSRDVNDAGLRRDIETQFAALGVATRQLDLRYTQPVWDVYREVDVALDCFPHNSGTTTFEALWMGVPVVTLAGGSSVGRLGASILSCIGRPEWIASDGGDYVERAVALARDHAALAAARAALRPAMLASPLLDQAGFVRNMEAAYRAMWRQWCAAAGDQPSDRKEIA